jgi:hypothetical protein
MEQLLNKIDRNELEVEKVAYSGEKLGYIFKATYLVKPAGMSLIEISKGDVIVREFLFPSYKIWNIAAHADDIVEGLERDNDSGLRVAGSDGLVGNQYPG